MADLPVEIWQLVRDEQGRDIVMLRDEQGRVLLIEIGVCEAASIWVRLAPDTTVPYLRRPWSHDLMQSMLERLGAQLLRVVIDDCVRDVDKNLIKYTFYATLHLTYRGQEVVVDARPSDATALALRMGAPLFVNTQVMDDHAILPEGGFDDGPEPWDTLS